MPITTFCLFWNFSRNGSYHICLHKATHGQLVALPLVAAPWCQPLLPSQKCHHLGPTECEVVGASAWRRAVPDGWRKRSQTSAKAALLPGGTANQPRMSNLVRSDVFNTETHIVCNPCAISMKLLSKPNLRTQTTHNESQVMFYKAFGGHLTHPK